MKYIFALSFALLSACASHEYSPSGRRIRSESEYVQTLEKFSKHERKYSGFYNTVDMEGTLLTSEMAEAQLDQNTRLYQWDEKKYQEELGKFQGRLAKETEIFLSFFTPERKNDNLHKVDTMWKVFLDVDGKRYDGKVQKIKQLPSEIQGLYPYYVRFSTPYSVIFPVAMKSIEGKEARLTVTGPVGSGSLLFNQR